MNPAETSETAAKSVEALTMELAVTRAVLERSLYVMKYFYNQDTRRRENELLWSEYGIGGKAIAQAEKVLNS